MNNWYILYENIEMTWWEGPYSKEKADKEAKDYLKTSGQFMEPTATIVCINKKYQLDDYSLMGDQTYGTDKD